MDAAGIGMFIGAFLVSLVVTVIWLLITKFVPPLKRNPKLAYLIAMALAVAIQIGQINGVSIYGLLGALGCCVLIFLQMKRAQGKLANSNR